eukprot:6189706-Pleurochrysis_carterae.AAC.2
MGLPSKVSSFRRRSITSASSACSFSSPSVRLPTNSLNLETLSTYLGYPMNLRSGYKSQTEFCIGVPERHQQLVATKSRHATLTAAPLLRMQWHSSRITRHQRSPKSEPLKRSKLHGRCGPVRPVVYEHVAPARRRHLVADLLLPLPHEHQRAHDQRAQGHGAGLEHGAQRRAAQRRQVRERQREQLHRLAHPLLVGEDATKRRRRDKCLATAAHATESRPTALRSVWVMGKASRRGLEAGLHVDLHVDLVVNLSVDVNVSAADIESLACAPPSLSPSYLGIHASAACWYGCSAFTSSVSGFCARWWPQPTARARARPPVNPLLSPKVDADAGAGADADARAASASSAGSLAPKTAAGATAAFADADADADADGDDAIDDEDEVLAPRTGCTPPLTNLQSEQSSSSRSITTRFGRFGLEIPTELAPPLKLTALPRGEGEREERSMKTAEASYRFD